LTKALINLNDETDPGRPLIFIGHSLGCHIISSFLWDINRYKQLTVDELQNLSDPADMAEAKYVQSISRFRQLDTVARLVMMGSNMPLFTFTFGPQKVYPVSHSPYEFKEPAFPGRSLPQNIYDQEKWLNFYSKNDLLGYPLKPLNNIYDAEKRLKDIPVKSEGWLKSFGLFSPLNTKAAHTGYWTNKKVIRDTASMLVELIDSRD
jgi:hypothetical protein